MPNVGGAAGLGAREPSTMVEEQGGLGGFALGVGLGAILWNGIFLGCSALGLMPGEWAWLGIEATYALAGFWYLAMLGIGARR